MLWLTARAKQAAHTYISRVRFNQLHASAEEIGSAPFFSRFLHTTSVQTSYQANSASDFKGRSGRPKHQAPCVWANDACSLSFYYVFRLGDGIGRSDSWSRH